MKQADVTAALDAAHIPGISAVGRCHTARIVAGFLEELLPRASFLERQILRVVRGYVVRWLDAHCNGGAA